MKLHSKVTLNEDVELKGYKTLKAGTKLEVVKYNKRYVYCIEAGKEKSIIQLTYKNLGLKSPIKRKSTKKPARAKKDAYGDEFIDILYA